MQGSAYTLASNCVANGSMCIHITMLRCHTAVRLTRVLLRYEARQ
jgi:hypothetical protein